MTDIKVPSIEELVRKPQRDLRCMQSRQTRKFFDYLIIITIVYYFFEKAIKHLHFTTKHDQYGEAVFYVCTEWWVLFS